MGARRGYVRVADQVGHEKWNNDELAGLVRLMTHLHERWARDGRTAEEAGQCEIGMADVMRITGKGRVDVARTSLGHLADIASISVEYRADVMAINWPKFSDFQGLASHSRPKLVPPVPVPVPVPVKEEEQPPNGASAPPDFLKAIRGNPSYSHIDITAELGRMDAWLLAHPGRKKTKRFIVNWLNKIEAPLPREVGRQVVSKPVYVNMGGKHHG